MVREKSKTGINLSYLLIGGGIGAILALLFASKSGQELRTDIADATRKGLDKTEEIAAQLGEKANTVYQDTKAKAGEVYGSAKEKLISAEAALSEIPGDLQNAFQGKADQISSSIEAGKREFDREGKILEHKSASASKSN